MAQVGLLREVQQALSVPIADVVSDGQASIRKAVQTALAGVPHQLCHSHYLREAAKPLNEADRHAKKELEKLVRGVRPIERQLESRPDDAPVPSEAPGPQAPGAAAAGVRPSEHPIEPRQEHVTRSGALRP